jgi:hypothetical protein
MLRETGELKIEPPDADFQGWGSVWGVASTAPHLELVEIVKCPESKTREIRPRVDPNVEMVTKVTWQN